MVNYMCNLETIDKMEIRKKRLLNDPLDFVGRIGVILTSYRMAKSTEIPQWNQKQKILLFVHNPVQHIVYFVATVILNILLQRTTLQIYQILYPCWATERKRLKFCALGLVKDFQVSLFQD